LRTPGAFTLLNSQPRQGNNEQTGDLAPPGWNAAK